jgi:hypothetical protein
MSEPPQRFFFVHLLKTGGTTLFTRVGGDPEIELEHEVPFPEAAIYPNATDGDVFTVAPQLSIDQLRVRWAERAEEIRIVMGHFPMCTIELLPQPEPHATPFTTLTVLREPVERTLSFLRHHRKLTPSDRNLPLETIYEDEFRYKGLIENHMVKMFSLTTDEMTDGMLTRVDFTRAHLERAKDQLSRVDVVGLQDQFEAFCAEIEARFGWELGEPMFTNRTLPVEVSDSFRRRIADDNALDMALWDYAQHLYADRLKQTA